MNTGYESILLALATFFFILSVGENIFFWLATWQQKNFNTKRVIISLLETKEGRSVLIGWENILKWLIVIYFFATIFSSPLLDNFPYIVCGIYFISAGNFVYKIITKRAIFPVVTKKTIILGAGTILVTVMLYIFPLVDKFLWLFFLDKFATVVLWLGIFIFMIFSDLAQDVIINRAIRKRNMFKDLIVIGIAGSYGKSETKEFLSSILSHSFDVLATKTHQYSPVAVAQTILRHLTFKKQIFIVDINPYQPGQTLLVSQIIRPTIGILTAINEHYFALFGSEQKIVDANYELINALPQKGLALVDVSNSLMFRLLRKTKMKKVSFTANNSPYRTITIRAHNIELKKFAVSFSIYMKNNELARFTVHLLGKHVVDELLPVVYLALHLGMPMSEIKSAVSQLRPLPHIMNPYRSSRNVTLIDDTYHSNPATIAEAVDYLSAQKGTKVFVLQPMLELGKKAKPDHFKVACLIASVCDYLIVTNSNYHEQIKKGVEEANSDCQLLRLSPHRTAKFIDQNLGAADFVVFEGKEAYSSFRILSKKAVLTA